MNLHICKSTIPLDIRKKYFPFVTAHKCNTANSNLYFYQFGFNNVLDNYYVLLDVSKDDVIYLALLGAYVEEVTDTSKVSIYLLRIINNISITP